MKKKTLVIGASERPDRYSNRAANQLLNHGHLVELIGLNEGSIQGNPIRKDLPVFGDIDTVTLYVSPRNQPEYYDYICTLKPRRVIFNPGAENPEFERVLAQSGIEPIEGCTLVMLATGQY